MKPVGVGIVGCAHACRDLHRPVITKQPELWEIRALYDLDRSRAESEAAEFGPPAEVMDSLDDLLAREDVELVLVLTKPPTTHHAVTMPALRAGKHVMVEKPMAQTTAECDEMIAAAEAAGVVFTVHQNRRWDDDFTQTRDLIASGAIGEPQYLRVWMNGAGWDWGVHVVDWMLQLSRGNLVSLRGWAEKPEAEEQGPACAILDFDQRPLVVLDFLPGPKAEGDHPAFGFPLFYVLGEDSQTYVRPWNGQWPNMFPIYEELYRAIREGGPVPVDPRSARNDIYVLELMAESARQGRPLPADNWMRLD